MATTINVKSTVTQVDAFAVEVEDSTLLGTRYFPNSEGDNFVGKEVLFDFDSSDLEKGAFMTTQYKDGNTVNWLANSVVPPRVANSDTVDPKGLDRVIFERFCRAQGADVNRSQAYQDLLVLKAARLAKRTDRAIEMLAALVLAEGKIDFDQPHDASTSGVTDHISVKYYDPAKGADNHYIVGTAWGNSGAHPYDDVCKMLNEGIARGRRYDDLILGANAWVHLSKDQSFKDFAGATFHSEGMMLDFGEIEGAQHVARCVFNGIQLNVIVYSGAYKAADGTLKQYIDPNAAILISQGIGRTLCGGCTLLNDDVSYSLENCFVDLRGKHCISLFKDFNNQQLAIREESRPLPAPRLSANECAWIYCDTSMALSGGGFGEAYKGAAFKHVDTSGQTVTPTTPASCAVTACLGGSSVTITPAATNAKTYKYYALHDGVKGDELTLASTSLTIPHDNDRDADGKALILVVEQ